MVWIGNCSGVVGLCTRFWCVSCLAVYDWEWEIWQWDQVGRLLRVLFGTGGIDQQLSRKSIERCRKLVPAHFER